LWLIDLATGVASPLSTWPRVNGSPVWSPDGAKVVFASNRDGVENLFVKTIGSAAPEEPFYRSDVSFKHPSSWSPDGKWIVVTQSDPGTAHNIYLLPAADPRELQPFARGPMREIGGRPGQLLRPLRRLRAHFFVAVSSASAAGVFSSVMSGWVGTSLFGDNPPTAWVSPPVAVSDHMKSSVLSDPVAWGRSIVRATAS